MIRPLYDRVVIKRVKAEEQTAGGLYIPTEAQTDKAEGEVIATGNGKPINGGFAPMSVAAGDKVLFSPNAGVAIRLDGVDYLMMNEADILGVKG